MNDNPFDKAEKLRERALEHLAPKADEQTAADGAAAAVTTSAPKTAKAEDKK